LEFGVLLPNTTEVVANAYTNTDLFWALRGGGAPSFGIITSTTYRTHPIVPLTSAFFTSTFTDPAVRRKLLTAWMSIQTKVRDAGWSGLWPYDETSLAITLLSQGNPPTNSAALSTMQNFYNLAKNMTGVNVTLATFKAYPSYYQWYYDNDLHTELGLGVCLSFMLIDYVSQLNIIQFSTTSALVISVVSLSPPVPASSPVKPSTTTSARSPRP
jgi:hypothetical protein